MKLESKIQGVLLSIRAYKNSCILINSLPDELMSAIFEETKPASNSRDRDFPDRLTHVCRRWRSVAVADPRLWSDVQITNGATEYTSMFLERSSGLVPISITFPNCNGFPPEEAQKLQEVLSAHSARIGKLVHENYSSIPVVNMLQLPNLNTFAVKRGDGIRHGTLRGPLPRLRELDLITNGSWPSGLFVNLSILTLRGTEWGEDIGASFFLDVLDGSPLLQELSLVRYVLAGLPAVSHRTATLCHLSILNLEFCNSRVILSHLNIPLRTTITLSNVIRCPRGHHTTDFFEAVPDKFPRLHNAEHFEFSSGHQKLSIKIADSHGNLTKIHGTVDNILEAANHRCNFSSEVVESILKRNIFTLVTSLVIGDGVCLSTVSVSILLMHLNPVQKISVNEYVVNLMLKALRPQDHTILCPNLKELKINVWFNGSPEQQQTWWSEFTTFLEERSMAKCPILDVEIELNPNLSGQIPYDAGRTAVFEQCGLERFIISPIISYYPKIYEHVAIIGTLGVW